MPNNSSSGEGVKTDDAQAVLRAQKDPSAFSWLYNKYHEQIFIFIYKRVETEEIAADICSNTFLNAMQHIGKYEDRGFPFSSWLYRIAINEVNQFFRKNKRAVRTVSIERDHAVAIAEESDDAMELEMVLQNLESVLATIDEPLLALIEMRFFDQKSFKEIGKILGISEGNAKIKTYRALDKLKKKLTKKE